MACFPTNLEEPFAAVMRISFSFAKSMLIALSSTNTSSGFKTKRSSSMFDERKTLTPFSLISVGLYVKPLRVSTKSENLRCSQGVEKPGKRLLGIVWPFWGNISNRQTCFNFFNSSILLCFRSIIRSQVSSISAIFCCSATVGIGMRILAKFS